MHAEPPSLFIIHKRERLSPEESKPQNTGMCFPNQSAFLPSCPSLARPLQAYFIINNRIYQSPDMYTVLSNRLARIPFFFFLVSIRFFFGLFNANDWSLRLVNVSLFLGIVAGRSAQVQARLHTEDWVCVAYHGDDGKGRRWWCGRRGQQEAAWG